MRRFENTCAALVVLTAFVLTGCHKDDRSAVAPPPAAKTAVDVEALRAKAESGNAQAQAELARYYIEGLQANYKEAARFARAAAEAGVPDGQFALATLIEAGRTGTNGESEAVIWYRKAAETGHRDAQYSLALMYATARGTPKDKEESVKWFRAAAEQGLAEAQFNLAQRYEHGQGVAKSPAEALVWFSLAAAQGIPDAVKSAGEMKAALSPEQIAEAEKRVAAFVAKTGLPGGK